MKNRVSGLLLETGVSHNKQRLHKVKYFRELLTTNKEVDESKRPLLKRRPERPEAANGCPVLRKQKPRREAQMRAATSGMEVLARSSKRYEPNIPVAC
jgi:hypothetical protein